MPERSYRVLLWTLALVGLAADQASKYGVFSWLRPVASETVIEEEDVYLPPQAFALFQSQPESRFFALLPRNDDPDKRRGFFLAPHYPDGKVVGTYARSDEWRFRATGGFIPHVNPGALFGWKPFADDKHNNVLFAVISLLAACAIIFWSRHKNTGKDRLLCLSLGLILAGTLGNAFDRLVFDGVRDFLHWNYLYSNSTGWPVFNVADCCLVVGACLLLLQAFFAPASQPSPQESKQAELVAAESQG